MGFRVNYVLTRNDCIKCYISLFKEIILQQFDAFQTEVQGSLTKLCAFKASRGHSSKVVKLPIMWPGAENMEYLNNPWLHYELHLCCVINVGILFSRKLGITGFNFSVPLRKECLSDWHWKSLWTVILNAISWDFPRSISKQLITTQTLFTGTTWLKLWYPKCLTTKSDQ